MSRKPHIDTMRALALARNGATLEEAAHVMQCTPMSLSQWARRHEARFRRASERVDVKQDKPFFVPDWVPFQLIGAFISIAGECGEEAASAAIRAARKASSQTVRA